MATLKGQNLRVIVDDHVVAKSTSCTITLQSNTDDAGTKDDVGLASVPEVKSKSWNVSVESLDVTDAATMLTAIKSLTPFQLYWDEVSTTDNLSPVSAEFALNGQAYLTDLTLTFNNRENSAKSVQFSGTGAIYNTVAPQVQTPAGGAYTKGQNVRLFLSSGSSTPSAVIAAAQQLSLHVSLSVENASTKDTDGDWDIQEPTALSYDISTTALVRSGDTITSSTTGQSLGSLENIFTNGQPVKWLIANTSGANNRTKGTTIVSGSAILQQLTINAAVRQNASYTAQLQGYGEYTVGA